jgi:hypothetical protein
MGFYGTATAYKAYHLARGRDESAQVDADVEQALLVASEWLDGQYDWPGYKIYDRETQVRSWPRTCVVDRDGFYVSSESVPVEIEQATYEVAYRWLLDGAVLTPDHTPEKYKRVNIDGALSVEYRGLDAGSSQKQFPILAVVLAPLLGGSNASSLTSSMVRG